MDGDRQEQQKVSGSNEFGSGFGSIGAFGGNFPAAIGATQSPASTNQQPSDKQITFSTDGFTPFSLAPTSSEASNEHDWKDLDRNHDNYVGRGETTAVAGTAARKETSGYAPTGFVPVESTPTAQMANVSPFPAPFGFAQRSPEKLSFGISQPPANPTTHYIPSIPVATTTEPSLVAPFGIPTPIGEVNDHDLSKVIEKKGDRSPHIKPFSFDLAPVSPAKSVGSTPAPAKITFEPSLESPPLKEKESVAATPTKQTTLPKTLGCIGQSNAAIEDAPHSEAIPDTSVTTKEQTQQPISEETSTSQSTPKQQRTPKKSAPETPVTPRSSGRIRKAVDRLSPVPDERHENKTILIPEGQGLKLGDIPHVVKELVKKRADFALIILLHRLLFGRPGEQGKRKANLRQFCGFADASEMGKVVEKLEHHKIDEIRGLATILNLSHGGEKKALCERIGEYLMKPADLGESKPSPSPSPKAKAKGKRTPQARSPSKGPNKGEPAPKTSKKVVVPAIDDTIEGQVGEAEEHEVEDASDDDEEIVQILKDMDN